MADFVPVSKPRIEDMEKTFVEEALDDGWVSPAGDRVEEFEKAFSDAVDASYGASTTTGTSALRLCVEAAGIGEGDTVIVPSQTFASSAAAPMHAGADVEFVDISEDTFGIDPDKLQERLKDLGGADAVIPVHLFGMPCEMDAILDIAEDNGMNVIEDAAEAIGATYDGSHVGTLGLCGMFSFYGNKNITTGQGGMVVSDNPEVIRRARRLRGFGMVPDHDLYYYHTEAAWNFQMTNIQAAIGLGQVSHMDIMLEDRLRVLDRYKDELENVEVYPRPIEKSTITPWMTVVRLDSYEERKELEGALDENSIGYRPTFYPLPDQPAFPDEASGQSETAFELFNQCVCLPTYPDLPYEGNKLDRVVDTVNEVTGR